MVDKAKTRENLQKLADFVGTKTRSLGFEDGPNGEAANPGSTYALGINAPDTWTSTLADQEADSVREPLNNLASDFAGLHETLSSETNSPSLQDE
ncbi:hypothetical protein [Actinomyces sp. ZJ308]|uniref:hypothetical protein n=1 Tax=Actinomyces sp. ZJ308 TaxID=2708342 RepID=UPI001FBBFFC1|nr:hypothetical protein [Actinomyces sp. ZJ308]